MKKTVVFLLLPALLVLSFLFFYFMKGQRSSNLGGAGFPNKQSSNLERPSAEYSAQDRESNVNITVLLVSQQNMKNLENDFPDLGTEVNLNKRTAFVLYFNTHSVDLTQYDLKDLSYFQAGEKKYKPLAYKSYKGTGMMASHHMKGLLLFDRIDEREGELFIHGVGDKKLRKYRIILE